MLDLVGPLDETQALDPAASVGPRDLGQRRDEAPLRAAGEEGPLEAEPGGPQPALGEHADQEREPLGVDAPAGCGALVPLHVAPDVGHAGHVPRLELLQARHEQRRLALRGNDERERPGIGVRVKADEVPQVGRVHEHHGGQIRLANPRAQPVEPLRFHA
jgi:hypothetical protein